MKEKGKARLIQNLGIRLANPSAPGDSLGLTGPSASPQAAANPIDPGPGNQGPRSSGGPLGRTEPPRDPQESPRDRSHEKHRESNQENQGEGRKQINGQDRLDNPGKAVVAGDVFDGIRGNGAEAAAFRCLTHRRHSSVHPREPQTARRREMTADRGPDAKIACADSPRSENPCDLNRRRSGFGVLFDLH